MAARKKVGQEEVRTPETEPEYSMVSPGGHGSVTKYPECLPNEEWMRGMYADGCFLSVNGTKKTLEEALVIIGVKA